MAAHASLLYCPLCAVLCTVISITCYTALFTYFWFPAIFSLVIFWYHSLLMSCFWNFLTTCLVLLLLSLLFPTSHWFTLPFSLNFFLYVTGVSRTSWLSINWISSNITWYLQESIALHLTTPAFSLSIHLWCNTSKGVYLAEATCVSFHHHDNGQCLSRSLLFCWLFLGTSLLEDLGFVYWNVGISLIVHNQNMRTCLKLTIIMMMKWDTCSFCKVPHFDVLHHISSQNIYQL